MIKEFLRLSSRFTFTLILFAAASVHILMVAIPAVNRPGAIAASIMAALLIAMYDIGVFRVNPEEYDI